MGTAAGGVLSPSASGGGGAAAAAASPLAAIAAGAPRPPGAAQRVPGGLLTLSQIPGVQVVEAASLFEDADDDDAGFVRPFSTPHYVSENPTASSASTIARRFKFEQYTVGKSVGPVGDRISALVHSGALRRSLYSQFRCVLHVRCSWWFLFHTGSLHTSGLSSAVPAGVWRQGSGLAADLRRCWQRFRRDAWVP